MTAEASSGKGGIGRQFSWIAAGRGVGAGLQALSLVLVVRQVSPADFGVLAAALGLTVVIQSGFDFGLPTLAVKARSASASDPLVAVALRLNAISSVGMLVGLAGLWLALSFADNAYLSLVPLALSAAFERLSDTRLGIAVADGDARHNFVGLIGRRALAVAAFLILSLVLHVDPILAFTTSAALGAFASWVYSLFVIRVEAEPARNRPTATIVFRAAVHFWVNSFALQLRNLDATLATVFGGAVQGGFFGLASRLSVPLRLPATSMGAALLPAAARLSDAPTSAAAGTRRLLRTAAIGWAGCGVGYLVGILVVPILLPLLVGPDYDGAILPLQISLVGLCFAAFCSLAVPILQGWGRQRFVAATSVISTFVCLVGVLVGSLQAGAVGASVALAGSFAFQALLLAFALRREVLQKLGGK